MKCKPVYFICSLIFSAVLLYGCFGIRGGTGAVSGDLITTYYRGEDSLMYFISRLDFRGPDKEKLLMDFTFHSYKGNPGQVVANFTLLDEQKQHDLKRGITFHYAGDSLHVPQVKRIYTEPLEKDFRHRYTFVLSEREFYALLNHDPSIKFDEITYEPRKWDKKSAEILRKVIFSVEE